MGNNYLASDRKLVSEEMEEIIPSPPEDWTVPYVLKAIQVINDKDCTFIINEKTRVFSEAGCGLNISSPNTKITSLKIEESGIEYMWMGEY